jgi:2-keto-4-pentenoate hydratase/2-oxohepta-3-ene-1,7-dioic acid hydratase in catechol pathway
MRITHMQTSDGRHLLCDDSAGLALRVEQPDLTSVLRDESDFAYLAGAILGPAEKLGARALAPLRPGKIVGIGLNYRDHLEEAGAAIPSTPFLFSKFPSCVIGPDEPIVIDPTLTDRVDWEGELAVIVGRPIHNATVEEALDCVFGYTVANDVSARDIQLDRKELIRGKNLDSFCPLGPCVTTAEELGDPGNLRIATRLNGKAVQSSSTAQMVFGIGELLAFCSQSFTLEPGDMLLTGTPRGCGEYMSPRRSLQPGDELEVEIEGIGILRNPVTDGLAD